jgi:hypothetical protein
MNLEGVGKKLLSLYPLAQLPNPANVGEIALDCNQLLGIIQAAGVETFPFSDLPDGTVLLD